jgi:hypothetical protein
VRCGHVWLDQFDHPAENKNDGHENVRLPGEWQPSNRAESGQADGHQGEEENVTRPVQANEQLPWTCATKKSGTVRSRKKKIENGRKELVDSL